MPITLNGDTGIQTPMYNGTITANAVTPSVNMKNRIINGAMTIDQRNAGASVTAPTAGGYTLDRWYVEEGTDGAATIQQITDAPTGFNNSLRMTVTSADASLGTSQYFEINQTIEGFNTADLAFGTASASTVTLSFWVKSSLTGTFGGSLRNSAYNRSYPFSYTISSANTWEQKSITIAGDTTGTWIGATNGAGIRLSFCIAAGTNLLGTANAWAGANNIGATGSTNIMATNGATWQVTGVQLEVGSTATSFDYRPYGTELALCQRYYFRDNTNSHFLCSFNSSITGDWYASYPLPVPMRATPTYTITLGSDVWRTNSVFATGRTNRLVYVTFNITSTGTGYFSLNDITASAEL